jgi:signal transduction histidine kinase
MMRLFEHLMPRSITTQVTGVVAVSVLLGIAIVVTIMLLLLDPPRDSPFFTVARIADATRLVRAAQSQAEIDTLLAAIRGSGLRVERIASSELVPAPDNEGLPVTFRPALRQLKSQLGIDVLEGVHYGNSSPLQIVTRIDVEHALVFNDLPVVSLWLFLTPPAVLLMVTALVSAPLLSIYAVRWIIAPLTDVATAASAFGRSPQGDDVISRRGPREILRVTDALNDMRARIRALLDDRTRMLAAISHDLRTPLTRLRLRAERVTQDSLRSAMLSDLTHIGRMLDETLEYLRDDARSETVSRIDLPSLLQTICSDFADMGYAVSYVGPARLSYACRQRALSRAVTNVVENAVKHGSTVTVALRNNESYKIVIEVTDDGPGIPVALREKVLEPFFKGDDARCPDSSGFGLGLSIARDIIKRHGGGIEMYAADRAGLRVLMILPPETSLHMTQTQQPGSALSSWAGKTATFRRSER